MVWGMYKIFWRRVTKREQLVMIWNNVLTDWWAIWAWIDFVKVDTIPNLWEVKSEAQKFQSRLMLIIDAVQWFKKNFRYISKINRNRRNICIMRYWICKNRLKKELD